MPTTLHEVEVALSGTSPLDWMFAIVLVISTVTAFMRGLILSLVSLLGLLLAVFAAAKYSARVSPYLLRWSVPAPLVHMAAFLLLLLSVYLAASLLGRLLRGVCSAVGLGFLDRLAGAGFGFARGVLLLAALVLPLGPYLQGFAMARSSMFLPYLLPAAHAISFVVPRDLGYRRPAGDWMFSHWRIGATTQAKPEESR